MPPESHTRALCSLSPTSSRIPWLHLTTRSPPPHRAPSSHGPCSPPGRIPASYTPTWQRSSLVLRSESARTSQLVCDDIVDVGERSREGWAERDGGGCDSLGYAYVASSWMDSISGQVSGEHNNGVEFGCSVREL